MNENYQKRSYWKARKAFCKTVCGDTCPQLNDDIEGGGGLVVDCDKLRNFAENLKVLINYNDDNI